MESSVVDYEVVWEPQRGSQTLFITCPHYEVLYEGTRGNGKTDSLLMDFAQHCGEGFGVNWRGILFRQTYPQLADVVAKSKKWFFQIFPGAKFNAADYTWKWPDGEELLLRHMKSPDDYWNYHGHEYPWIGWEELTNWPDLTCYDKMKACSRSSFPGMPRKYRATCNPFGVGHGVVKMRFIDPAKAMTLISDALGERIRIHGNVEENKLLLAADPDYVSKLDQIEDDNLRKAWRYGDWDIVAGGMFTEMWEPSRHVLKPFAIPSSWRIDRSFDWGSSKPFSVLWWAESDGTEVEMPDKTKRNFPRGTLFLINEWYGWNGKANEGLKMLAIDVAKGIKERESFLANVWGSLEKDKLTVRPGPADNSIYDTQDGHCIADNMATAGVTWSRSDKSPGSRTNGWELLRGRLAASKKFPMEDPGLFIFDHCRQWLRTVPTLPRDEKKMDDVDCFIAGTMVTTIFGHIPIESIKRGDLVLTPIGFRRVTNAKMSGIAKTHRVLLSDGTSLEGTGHHKFITNNGIKPLHDLTCSDILFKKIILNRGLLWKGKLLTMALFMLEVTVGVIIRRAGLISGKGIRHYISKFIEITKGSCQSVGMFIISMATSTIIPLTTLSPYRRMITGHCTSRRDFQIQSATLKCTNGNVQAGGSKYSEQTQLKCERIRQKENLRAVIVERLLSQNRKPQSFVQKNVLTNAGLKGNPLRYALFAVANSIRSAIKQSPVHIIAGGPTGDSKPVYNLTVEEAHLYFANGILVSNSDAEDHCGDATRYRVSMPRHSTSTQDMF